MVDVALAWVAKTASFIMKGPPKLYNPSFLFINRAVKRFNEVMLKEGGGMNGFGKAYNKARMETSLRKGTLVGTDYNGNKYYEDREAPYGRTRWVEYPTPPGVWAIEQRFDGSMVRGTRRPPAWTHSRSAAPLPTLFCVLLTLSLPPPLAR